MARVKPITLKSGPWKGVYTTNDPYDADESYLIDAKNTYIPDAMAGSGIYGRPGFRTGLGGEQLYSGAENYRGQAIYPHPMLDGSIVSFLVHGGRVFRVDASLQTAEDVTPVGITIDTTATTRVYLCSSVGNLIVNDGVHRPWVVQPADILSSPMVAQYIDYDGNGVAWTAYGQPVVFLGGVLFILNEVGGVYRRLDISYSEPGLPLVGYQQSGSDNNISVITSSGSPLYALCSTNTACYYFRAQSVGTITGNDISDLATSPSEDAIAFNVGSQAPATIAQFGSSFFFADAIGRPWLFSYGSPPKPIWYDMRGIVQDQQVASPATTAAVSSACIEPTLNKYIAALWSDDALSFAPPKTMYVFDAVTANYEGIWQVTDPDDPTTGLGLECIGILTDSSGRSQFVAMTPGGYVWYVTAMTSDASYLTTEGGDRITTEDGDLIVTESIPAVWSDNEVVPDIYVQTDRLGYEDSVNFNVDRVTITTLNAGPMEVTVNTSMTENTVQGYPEPSPSQDDTFRLVCGCDAMGRGPTVRVRPLTADDQFAIQRISLVAIPSNCGPEDA